MQHIAIWNNLSYRRNYVHLYHFQQNFVSLIDISISNSMIVIVYRSIMRNHSSLKKHRLLLYFSIFKIIFLENKASYKKRTFYIFDLFFYKKITPIFGCTISSEKPCLRGHTCRRCTLTLAFHVPVEMLQDAYYIAHPCVIYI